MACCSSETSDRYRLISISSRDRTVGSTGPSDFTVDIPGGVEIKKFRLVQAEIPFTWYTVNSNNYNIDFTENGGAEISTTVPAGNYTSTTIVTAIASALNGATLAGDGRTYSVTIDADTSKLTITTSVGTFSLLFVTGTSGSSGTDSHIGLVLGYTVTDKASASSITAENVYNLTGENYFYIKTSSISGTFNGPTATETDDNTVPNLARIPVNKNPGSIILFDDRSGTITNFVLAPASTSTLSFQLKFYNNTSLDLNGQEWSMLLGVFI